MLVSEFFCNFVGINIIPMNYPLKSENIGAIKAAESNFKELTNLRPVYDDKGQPLMIKGTFGVVSNNIIEIPIRIFCFIYSIVLFVFPFIMRSSGWQLLKISYYMLLANIVVFVFINIADMLRPSKKDHIGIGFPELCLGVIATFVPLLLMTDLVSEKIINENKYLSFLDLPSYQGEWYITFLIWVIWYISFVVYGSLMDEYYSLRVILFRTPKEKAIEQEEKEMERIRSEIREKELQRKRKLEE